MEMLTHLSINLFPMVMLAVIFVNNLKREQRTLDRRFFSVLIFSTIGYMATDSLAFMMDGRAVPGALMAFHIASILFGGMMGADWLVYVSCRLFQVRDKPRMKRNIFLVSAGYAAYAVFAVTTPMTGIAFSITEDRHYQRGVAFYIPFLLCIALVAWSMHEAWDVYEGVPFRQTRLECGYLMAFGVIPVVGILAQWWIDGCWLSGPSAAVAILYIYINTRNRQITTDGLTGLNNRSSFDEYVNRMANQNIIQKWGLLMIDVDEFKSINDTFGHSVGDEALWNTAESMRKAMGVDNSFLARYGGDEFAVIGEWRDSVEAKGVMSRIQRSVDRFNEEGRTPYRLSLSIGYCMWDEAEGGTVEELIEKADARMYESKQEKKKKKGIPADGSRGR